MIPSATTADAGRMIGRRYRLRSAVGRGGMGTVWLAQDELLGRAVAVKEVHLPPGLNEREREELRARLLREARVAARLDHPSAVRVYDVVEEDGWPYIVMEYVRAKTLDEVLHDDFPLPPARVAAIGLEVLGALEAAHAAGIVHRDVKPANIMIRDDGRVTLTDFGIATSSGESGLTSTGLLLGSPSYIAPERARGQVPGPSSDLWSLGATLYTAVEGHAPFERGEPFLTLAAITSEDHAPFDRAGPLSEVIEGLLAREPADRLDAAAARGLLAAVANAAPAPPAPAPDTIPAAPREPGARSTALPWSEVIAAAEGDPSHSTPPSEEDAFAAGALPTATGGTPLPAPAQPAEELRAAEEPRPAPAPPAEEPRAAEEPRPAPAPPAEEPRAAVGPRAPVLVPVLAPEALDPRGGAVASGPRGTPLETAGEPPVPRGTLPAAGPRRRQGLGFVLGLLVLLLAGYAATRLMPGRTAAGDAQVSATASAPASAVATPPAGEAPPGVAPDPAASDQEPQDSNESGSGDEDSSGSGSGDDSSGPGSGDEAPVTDDDTAAAPSEAAGQAPPAPAATAVPADFATYTSPEHGWTVRHPQGWVPKRRSETAIDLQEPGTGRYLRVDTTDTPGPSALGDWQAYEPSFSARHPGYQQIRMEQVDYRGLADAADWEYTYPSGNATLHAINRGFVLEDRSAAFALNFQTREPDWAGSRELFDQMAASFQVASFQP